MFLLFSFQIFSDHYHFHHAAIRKRSIEPSNHHQNRLDNDHRVKWSKQQRVKSRQKRDFLHLRPPRAVHVNGRYRLSLNDPKWPQMWYLVSNNKKISIFVFQILESVFDQ